MLFRKAVLLNVVCRIVSAHSDRKNKDTEDQRNFLDPFANFLVGIHIQYLLVQSRIFIYASVVLKQ